MMIDQGRRLIELFNRRERRQFYLLLAAIAATAAFEMVGVASVMPFLSLVANPELVFADGWIGIVYDRLGFRDPLPFVAFSGVAALMLLAVSIALSCVTTWLIYRFAWTQSHRLSMELFSFYMNRPYEYYLTANTARLQKNIHTETQQVMQNMLIPGLRALANAAVALALVALLFIVNWPVAMVVVLVLGGLYSIVYSTMRARQRLAGQRAVAANTKRFKLVGEGFGAAKTVKAMGLERALVVGLSGPSKEFSRCMASNAIASELPPYAMQIVAFGGAIAITLYVLLTTGDAAGVLPLIGLYAVAGYKLMPALQKVFAGITKARFSGAALDDIYADTRTRVYESMLQADPATDSTPAPFDAHIECHRVSYSYPGGARPAVRDANLVVTKRSCVGFVGETGSGKTTLVDLIIGLLQPTEGSVTIDGVVLTAANAPAWRTRVGYVPQDVFLADDSIAANIAFGVPADQIDLGAVRRAAHAASLAHFIQELPDGYETRVGERGVRISGGQRQRIGIARALYRQPDVLVMDEGTSALDPITEGVVMKAIEDLTGSVTILLVAHRLSTVVGCDQIVYLENGEVRDNGRFEDLCARDPGFRRMAEAASML
jgi:ATP-binding cassette, subfamily B, bacterial PglK